MMQDGDHYLQGELKVKESTDLVVKIWGMITENCE